MDKYLIYPKQLQRVNIPIEKNRCFVIMPFKEELDYIYGSIKKGLIDKGYICTRVDEISGSTPIINKILTEMLRARYIIADLTDCNPNVFYELGIAHSFKDAQNVIILKRKGSKVPFDITHLTYFEYDIENPKYLISSILKTIQENSYLNDFRESLNIRGIIPFVKDNGDYFIDFLQAELQTSITELTLILSNNISNANTIDIEHFIRKYQKVINKAILSHDEIMLAGVFKVYQEILISCSSLIVAQESAIDFLEGTFFSVYDISEKYVRECKTNMAIALANNSKMLSLVLPWIIRYFSETKTASIDLNRYKLEAFLMTSTHPLVDETICNAVFDSNCYIREHMSDIIGEKHLEQGIVTLSAQLQREENYYSAISEIEALGKLNSFESVPTIIDWLERHKQNIVKEKQFFVLKHIKIVLAKLDIDGFYLKQFANNYDVYLKDYYIL